MKKATRKGERVYKYKLIQDGVVVARVESTDENIAFAEISRYGWIYSQDGPVTIKRVKS